MPSPGSYPPPRDYNSTPSPKFHYHPGYYRIQASSLGDHYSSPASQVRDAGHHSSRPESDMWLPPRKKPRQESFKGRMEMPATTEVQNSSEPPGRKIKTSSRGQSAGSEGELHEAALELERAGVLKLPPGYVDPTPEIKKQLKEEYQSLYQQREDIQTRMNAIKDKLATEEYQALVREIENPQLAKLYVEGGPTP